jgi:Tfp pilus assembly protein PilV
MKRGMLLTELLIALAIASMALLVVVGLSTRSVSDSGFFKHQTEANALAREGLEWVKVQRNQLGWGEVFGKSGATYCINDLTWAAAPCSGYVGDGNVYTRTVTINEKLPSTTPARLVVGVVVTWKEGRKSFTSQLETELTNY